jgi:phosphate transport system substrate-binding protein
MLEFNRLVGRWVQAWAALLLVSLLVSGSRDPAAAEISGPLAAVDTDASLARYTPSAQVTGTFKIHGSETMHPLLTRLSLEFQRRQPKVAIDLKAGGSTKAIAEFIQPPLSKSGKIALPEERAGQFKLVAASRELFDSEFKEFVTQYGYEPTIVPVAVDAVALYVHRDNPLPGLTLSEVDAMFSTTRLRGHPSAITSWGHVGLAGGWEKSPIQLYGRDRKSGTRAFFQEHCLAGGEFSPGVHEDPGAASVILDVSRDQLGIGYSGLGLQASSVRMVPLAEAQGTPYIMPSASTVADQTYPLRRVLYLYVNQSPKESLPPAAHEFLMFITSYEGQEAVKKAGFFPLPPAQATQTAVALSRSASGNAAVVR